MNANQPAMPVNTYAKEGDIAISTNEFQGLTKRELFAKDIFCALVSNSNNNSELSEFINASIRSADALLSALDTPKE